MATFFVKKRVNLSLSYKLYCMKSIRSTIQAAAWLVLSAALQSCSADAGLPFRTESVAFTLPAWPPENNVPYPPVSYWDVRYCAGGSSGTLTLGAEDGADVSFTLELTADTPCAVCAQPVTLHGSTESAFFRPAGCVYPAGSSITWEDGFSASICMQLYRASESSGEDTAEYLAQFNWKKFCSVLAEKAAADGPGWDPWMLDRTAVCSAVAARSFSSTLLTVKDCFTVETVLLSEMAAELSSGTGAETLFIPRYVPSYREQRETGTAVLKTGTANSYLYTIQQIAVITGADADSMTLEITAVPLYTGKQ